jgi:hypothetical protein
VTADRRLAITFACRAGLGGNRLRQTHRGLQARVRVREKTRLAHTLLVIAGLGFYWPRGRAAPP